MFVFINCLVSNKLRRTLFLRQGITSSLAGFQDSDIVITGFIRNDQHLNIMTGKFDKTLKSSKILIRLEEPFLRY